MHDTMEEPLVLGALRLTLGQRRPGPGLLHHADHGSRYAGGSYQALLAAQPITDSMSGKGNCWDNTAAESFFATLEFELIMRHDWATNEEAHRAIFRYIEMWYNRKRRHSTLGYVSPAEYEAQREQAA